MTSWKIKQDKIEELRTSFSMAGIYGDAAIARDTRIAPSSLQRIMKLEIIHDADNLNKLLARLVAVKSPSIAREQLRDAVNNLRQEYCEEIGSGSVRQKNIKPELSQTAPSEAVAVLESMTVYVKFLHLRDRRSQDAVYRKFVPRLGKIVEVYDEFTLLKTLCFRETQRGHEFYGRSTGVVDIQPIYPPRDHTVFSDPGLVDVEGVSRHLENQPGRLFQAIIPCINGFQHGKEDVGAIVPEDCMRVVFMADMTSLPMWSNGLVLETPLAFHTRMDAEQQEIRQMSCWKAASGVWVVDSALPSSALGTEEPWDPNVDRLLRNDKVELRFKIDWQVVSEICA